MTLQQAFDHARAHLLAQNAQAMDELKRVHVLLDAEGRRCALGCFIPPDKLTPGEAGGYADSIIEAPQWRDYFTVTDCANPEEFYYSLMCIHDNNSPGKWDRNLREMALDWNLTINDEVSQ